MSVYSLRSNANLILVSFAVIFSYFLFAKIGLLLTLPESNVSPVWPPAGIALASMLLFGFRILTAIVIGAFLACYLSGFSAVASFGICIGNSTEAGIGYFLLERFAKGADFLEHVENVLKFVLVAGILCTIPAALIGTAFIHFGGIGGDVPFKHRVLDRRANF